MDDLAISKNGIHPEQTEIIMYQTEDGLTKIDVRMENETVWLTQAQMAELFQRERSGITKHIKNVFAEGEVDEKSNVKNVHIANSDKPVAYYSLRCHHLCGLSCEVVARYPIPNLGQFRAERIPHQGLCHER